MCPGAPSRCYAKAGKLTARALAQILRSVGRKIQKAHRAHQTPHGKQTVRQLMGHGEATASIPVEAPALFDRVARRWKVDYAFYQQEPGKYLLFFKSKQADAITACMSDYSRRVLDKGKTRRVPSWSSSGRPRSVCGSSPTVSRSG